MTTNLSIIAASRGMCSQISRPGHVGRDRPVFAPDSLGRVGLEVKHVLVRRAAGQEDHDDRFMGPGDSRLGLRPEQLG